MPLGTPPTAKVTGPEFPVTVVVIFAGVPSCGASASGEERERLRAPDAPPEAAELPQARGPSRGTRNKAPPLSSKSAFGLSSQPREAHFAPPSILEPTLSIPIEGLQKWKPAPREM